MFKSLFLAACLFLSSLTLESKSIEQHVYDTGVIVLVERSDSEYQCSGTLIGRQDLKYTVLTAAHCKPEPDALGDWSYVVLPDRASDAWKASATILILGNKSKGQDYLLLSFTSTEYLDIAELDQTFPKLGEQVLSNATPGATNMKVLLEGIVAKPLSELDDSFWPKAALVQIFGTGPGASGGGIFTKSGKLCGVIVGGTGNNLTVILPLAILEGLNE